jgi:thiol-disulfide isomerase/thioredoxin
MKKLHLLIILLIAGFTLSASLGFAQEVEREYVVLEIGTGTWCGYCPGAAMGADDLVENGHDVAVIENHNGDDYANDASNARNSYYAISGYPTAFFDGVVEHVGGNSSSSIYSTYLPLYEQRKAIPSKFTLDVGGEIDGTTISLGVDATMVDEYVSDQIVLQIAITESHIPESWGGLDELNFVNRMMIPDHNGTPADFSSNDVLSFELTATLDASWDQSHMEVVVFLQDNATKEVLQGFKSSFEDLAPLVYPEDAEISNLTDVTSTSCQGEIAPCVTLTNSGLEELTSCDIEYNVNGYESLTYSWTGSLAPSEFEVLTLPAISFEPMDENTISVATTTVNGIEDPNTGANVLSATFESAETTDAAYIVLMTDNNPEETTWELRNGAGELIDEGGPFTQANSLAVAYLQVETDGETDCFSFIIRDSGGDGLTDGAGEYKIMGPASTIIYQGNEFGDYKELEFTVMDYTGVDNIDVFNTVNIYPNPTSSSANVSLNLDQASDVSVSVYDSFGRVVYELTQNNMEAGESTLPLLTEDLAKGVYYVNVNINGNIQTEKLILK